MKPLTRFDDLQAEINKYMKQIKDAQDLMGTSKIFVTPTQGIWNEAIGANWGTDASPASIPALGAIYCNYNGKRVKLISRDYQTGLAVLEDRDVTGPYTLTVPIADVDIENPHATEKCTCGHDSLMPSLQGKHSDWCTKFFKF